MKIVVCVKPTLQGELNPFDAAAYEAALRLQAEVILLAMAPPSAEELLLRLTRLGAKEAYLLSDPAFAGADTLATSYTLSLALRKLLPDLVFCGRQTMEGDTGQVGPGLARRLGFSFAGNVMQFSSDLSYVTRFGQTGQATSGMLLTFERIFDLRFPGIRSKTGTLIRWSAKDLQADPARCGLSGSPTRVVRTERFVQDKRKCKMIAPAEVDALLRSCRAKKEEAKAFAPSAHPLKEIWSVGDKPLPYAQAVAEKVRIVPCTEAEEMARLIRTEKPAAVLWASDPEQKQIAAQVAVLLETGLCADCTALETDGTKLLMTRPAFAGDVIATIACRTLPAMATVRTFDAEESPITVSYGLGAKGLEEDVIRFAQRYTASLGASRGAVDASMAPYEYQVGLTGKTVHPQIYVALGISGAVHHLVGMKSSGLVIAVNRDKNAPIFDYADYGVAADLNEFFKNV